MSEQLMKQNTTLFCLSTRFVYRKLKLKHTASYSIEFGGRGNLFCALDTLLVCYFGKSGRGMHIRHIGPAPQNLNNHIYWWTPNRFHDMVFLFTKKTTLVKNQYNDMSTLFTD